MGKESRQGGDLGFLLGEVDGGAFSMKNHGMKKGLYVGNKLTVTKEKEGKGEGKVRRLGLTYTDYYIQNRETTRTDCLAQETILNILQ